jgi:hypothetical protein
MIDPFNPPIKIDKTEYRLPIIWSKCKRWLRICNPSKTHHYPDTP